MEWHYYKISAFDLQSLLHDFELYKKNHEVNLVRDALKMSESGTCTRYQALVLILTLFFFFFKLF